MKKIRFVRHADKGKGQFKHMLSPEGIETARAFGAEALRGKGFTHLATTAWFRTAQTLSALAEGAGDFTAHRLDVVPLLTTNESDEEYAELVAFIEKAGGKQSLPELVACSEELAWSFAARYGERLEQYLATLPDGANVLLVAHSPIIEMCVWFFTGMVPEALKPLGWIELETEEGSEKIHICSVLSASVALL